MKKLFFKKKQKYTGIVPDLTKYGFIELNREQLYEVNGGKDKSKGSEKKSGDKKTGESVSGMLSEPPQNTTIVITVSVDEKSFGNTKDEKTLGGQKLTESGSQSGTNVGPGNSENTAIVKKGDTLSQIVYEYNKTNGTNLTVGEVAKNSGIENPDLIHPGEEIKFLIGENSVSVAQEKSDISELQFADGVGTVIDSSTAGRGVEMRYSSNNHTKVDVGSQVTSSKDIIFASDSIALVGKSEVDCNGKVENSIYSVKNYEKFDDDYKAVGSHIEINGTEDEKKEIVFFDKFSFRRPI